MQVWFPTFGRQSERFFEPLPRDTSFQYAMKLLRVDVQRSFFGGACSDLGRRWMRWLLLRRRRHLWRHGVARRLMVHHRGLRALRVWTANVVVDVALRHSLARMHLRRQRWHLARDLLWRSGGSFILDRDACHSWRLPREAVRHRRLGHWVVCLARCRCCCHCCCLCG